MVKFEIADKSGLFCTHGQREFRLFYGDTFLDKVHKMMEKEQKKT